jgi:hypothetical protein
MPLVAGSSKHGSSTRLSVSVAVQMHTRRAGKCSNVHWSVQRYSTVRYQQCGMTVSMGAAAVAAGPRASVWRVWFLCELSTAIKHQTLHNMGITAMRSARDVLPGTYLAHSALAAALVLQWE